MSRKNSSFPIQSVRQVSLPGHEIQDLLLGRGVSEGSGLPVVGAAGVDAAGDQAGLLFCDLALVDGEQHLINNRPVLWMAVPAVAEVAQRIDNFRAVVDLPGLEDVGMVANDQISPGVHEFPAGADLPVFRLVNGFLASVVEDDLVIGQLGPFLDSGDNLACLPLAPESVADDAILNPFFSTTNVLSLLPYFNPAASTAAMVSLRPASP